MWRSILCRSIRKMVVARTLECYARLPLRYCLQVFWKPGEPIATRYNQSHNSARHCQHGIPTKASMGATPARGSRLGPVTRLLNVTTTAWKFQHEVLQNQQDGLLHTDYDFTSRPAKFCGTECSESDHGEPLMYVEPSTQIESKELGEAAPKAKLREG